MCLLNEEELFQLVDRVSVQFFQKPFKHKVCYNHRLRTTGGRYLPASKCIELNPKYAIETNESEFIGIIKHELCHYHLHIENKGYGHRDPEFKALLKETGSPRYCKPLPSNAQRRKHVYECVKCGFIYKRVRKVNTRKYRCGKCGEEIYLKGL